ncbi:DMT family transporter [Paenibacillus alkalitolerans]|uniref:DMT family transporter n=1 Tax=Paenibacillus alkalitolerans TaxID=2799335 RepID=UPI0018F3C970|nr:multidrug efflux SMR transporter [Paenibacillus alkalitolerans]
MAWVFLVLAGFAEVGGVISLKLSEGFRKRKPTVASVLFGGASFYLLALSLQTLPIGTAYAVWTGIGSVGSVAVGMIFFRESKHWIRILFISFVLIGIVGLRFVSEGH